MLKSILSAEQDLRDAQIIERRQRVEKEREQKFSNEKQRNLCINCDDLKNQLLEKDQKLTIQQQEAQMKVEKMRKNLEMAESHERELNELKKKTEKEIESVLMDCQHSKKEIDFDTNDPNGKRENLPGSVDYNDPRSSVSSGQMFNGEDLMNSNRIREQKYYLKHCLDQQIAEKKALEKSRKQSEKEISDSMNKYNAHAIFMGHRVDNDKREIQRQILEYNLSMGQQKRENDKRRKEIEQQDNMAEIFNFLSSEMINENQGSSSDSPMFCDYNRLTTDQIEAMKVDQDKRSKDIQKRKSDQEIERKRCDEINEEMDHKITIKEHELYHNIRQMNRSIRDDNEEFTKEQNNQGEK